MVWMTRFKHKNKTEDNTSLCSFTLCKRSTHLRLETSFTGSQYSLLPSFWCPRKETWSFGLLWRPRETIPLLVPVKDRRFKRQITNKLSRKLN